MMKKTIILFLESFFILIYGWGGEPIKQIKFIYSEPDIQMIDAVPSSDDFFGLLYDVLQVKVVTDSSFIHKFNSYLLELKPDPARHYIDARIMAIISFKDSSKRDTLCFGEYQGIDLNGNFIIDNKKMLDFVKQEVWSTNASDCSENK